MKELNTLLFFFCMFIFFAIAFDPGHVVDRKVLGVHDKFKHIVAFFILSYFLFTSSVKIHYFFKFFILVFIGFFIEYIQSKIGREASMDDFLASFLGIILFIIGKYLTKKIFKKPIKPEK